MLKTQSHEHIWKHKSCAVIVAHPDDETLWAGGIILMHPEINWTVLTLCRLSDPDRSLKFLKAVGTLGATGIMGDLDDGPEQIPIHCHEVRNAIIELLPEDNYDLIITHDLRGEYTRHRRHEDVGRAVVSLWENEDLTSKEIWRFAYEDSNRKHLPIAIKDADLKIRLSPKIWEQKYKIITDIYGFDKDGFEAKATPKQEAFWCFKSEH